MGKYAPCWFLLSFLGAFWSPGSSLRGGEVSPRFDVRGDVLHIQTDERSLLVSLQAPTFAIGDEEAVGGIAPTGTSGSLAEGQTLEVAYPSIRLAGTATMEVRLLLRWSQSESVLRKTARFRLVDSGDVHVLKEIVLDRIDRQGRPMWTHGKSPDGKGGLVILGGPQSHPVFLPSQFVGIEYPVASTRCEGEQIVLAHRPGQRLQPLNWYESRPAVYGMALPGREVHAFQQYIAAQRPAPKGLHVNYNSWWTSPVPYTEQDILGLMKVFDEKLNKVHGVSLDTFCIDLGWSNPKSVWEIDAGRFPEGFASIRDAAHAMNAHLGLWISPSSYYSGAVDNEWAQQQGFESFTVPSHSDKNATVRLLCLGGKRYGERFRDALVELVSRWDIHHLKLDGCSLVCPATDHGHEPGECSSEAIAAGVIAAVEAARQADPQVWIETTCFGYNPSPWWLLHVNSVIGTFGDDAPVGRVPAPVYRESYTTARDYFNLQGAELLPIPSAAQEVLGVVHQTAEPYLNDAIMTVMRGHMFLPLYVNPRYMSDDRWQDLADLLQWTRTHSHRLGHAVPLLPVSWQSDSIPQFSDQGTMSRQPYGYLHRTDQGALVALRNPWIARQSYSLTLHEHLGLGSEAAQLDMVSLYPEPRVYGQGLKVGDTVEVPLAPYETVVLAIQPSQAVGQLPPATSAIGSQLKVIRSDCRLQRVAFEGHVAAFGPDWTSLLGEADSAVQVTLDVDMTVTAPAAELLVLCEGEKSPASPICQVTINGQAVPASSVFSDAGWSATLLPRHEHWTFLRVPLVAGDNHISGGLFAASESSTVSVWVQAAKPGSAQTDAGDLPQPETISLDSVVLIEPAQVAQLPAATQRMARPVERIDGLFLDTLEPVSVSQGYGTLQRNQSVWEKPMIVGGTPRARGLGTHAPSKIVYALEGKYRRFQSWAGADWNTYPTISFEVWVDGAKKWESGPTTRETPPHWIDLDISGAQTLELIVGDTGDLAADHADWADARLLR